MSDSSNLASEVTSDVVDEVDVGTALTGGDVTEDIDGESLGRSVGETVGETVGRLVGRNVVDWLLSKLAFWSDGDEDEEPSTLSRVGGALAVAVGRTLKKPEFKEPIGDALRGFVDQLEERQKAAAEAASDTAEQAQDAAEEAQETTSDTAEEAKETASDTAEEAQETTSDTAEGVKEMASDTAEQAQGAAEGASAAATEKASAAAEKLESGQMDEIRKETYRELLEMMEYSKLQSIAKESGVKANLAKDDMIDAIVEEFDAEEAGDSSESEASDGDADEE